MLPELFLGRRRKVGGYTEQAQVVYTPVKDCCDGDLEPTIPALPSFWYSECRQYILKSMSCTAVH